MMIAVYNVDGADSIFLNGDSALMVRGLNQGGYDAVDINIDQLLTWLKKYMPHVLEAAGLFIAAKGEEDDSN
jgi:hypothetical protein